MSFGLARFVRFLAFFPPKKFACIFCNNFFRCVCFVRLREALFAVGMKVCQNVAIGCTCYEF